MGLSYNLNVSSSMSSPSVVKSGPYNRIGDEHKSLLASADRKQTKINPNQPILTSQPLNNPWTS